MEHILSLSYGKDSLACLEACKQLDYPIDRIIHAEVWATDTIPADLPPMVEFKKYADKVIKDRYGLEVEHVCAMRERERERERLSFEQMFCTKYLSGKNAGRIYGFPMQRGAWCNSRLKVSALSHRQKSYIRGTVLQDTETKVFQQACTGNNTRISNDDKILVQQQAQSGFINEIGFSKSSIAQGADKNIVQYLGIAADEPERIARHKDKPGIILPLVDIGWDEAYCRKWCEENGLLSPIYTTASRGGCWFCHNQSVDQLRILRHDYPDLWQLLLKWDLDSPVTFRPDGHTVHDFDKRFQLEDENRVPTDRKFRWKMLDQ